MPIAGRRSLSFPTMALLCPFSEDDLERVREEWRRRDYRALGRALGRPDLQTMVDAQFAQLVKAIENGAPEAARGAAVAQAIGAIVLWWRERAGGDAEVAVAVVAYLYLRALHHWQLSADPWPLALIDGVGTALLAERPVGRSGGSSLVPAIQSYAQWLENGYLVENGFNCSCPVQVYQEATAAQARLAAAPASFGGGEGWLRQVRSLLREDARFHAGYFAGVAEVAGALCRWAEEGPYQAATDAVAAGGRSLAGLAGDSHETDLRSQLAALSSLVRSAEEPSLCIESARFTYLYPFVLLDDAGRDASLGASCLLPAGWALDEVQRSDIWTDAAERHTRRIALPELTVTTAGGPLAYQAEVRLGANHQHYVRLTHEYELPEVPAPARPYRSLHTVNQALRRASRAMGKETVQWTGGAQDQTRRTLLEFVDWAVAELEGAVGAARNSQKSLGNDFHVILATTAMQVQSPDGASRPARPEDLDSVFGASLVTREVRQMAAIAVDEWMLQDPAPYRNLLAAGGFEGELALATANTTVLYMPTSPAWVMADEYAEMAEFVATQRALSRKWEIQVGLREADLADLIAILEKAVADGDEPPDHQDVQAAEVALRKLEIEIHQERARLRSLSICRSRSYRSSIDALLESSPVPRTEQDLDRTLGIVSQRHDQAAAMSDALARRWEQGAESRERKAERDLSLAVAVLAVFGFLSWLHDLYAGSSWANGWRGVAIGVAVVGLVVGALIWWRARRRPFPR